MSLHLTIGVDDNTINNYQTVKEGYNTILGTLPADQENYKIFNSMECEWDDFVSIKSPWCLIHVTAIDHNGNKEDQMLSCLKKCEAGHYYMIESAT